MVFYDYTDYGMIKSVWLYRLYVQYTGHSAQPLLSAPLTIFQQPY